METNPTNEPTNETEEVKPTAEVQAQPTTEVSDPPKDTDTKDSNEVVSEAPIQEVHAALAASVQETQIAQGVMGNHPNQMMAPRMGTTAGAMAPAQVIQAPKVMPVFPPSENYKMMLDRLPNKSAKIRAMHRDGYTTSQISRHLGILYQHARNVLNQIIKRPTENQMGSLPMVVYLPTKVDENKLNTEAAKLNLTPDELRKIVADVQDQLPTEVMNELQRDSETKAA
jgi:hypothetical protein